MSLFSNIEKYTNKYEQIQIIPLLPDTAKVEYENDRLPVISVKNFELLPGEVIHFLEKAVLCSLDWKKSFVQEKGYFYITNRRITFAGKTKTVKAVIDSVQSVTIYEKPAEGMDFSGENFECSVFMPNRDYAYKTIELLNRGQVKKIQLYDYRSVTYFAKTLQNEGKSFIQTFRKLNTEIGDEEFTDILNRFDKVLGDTFDIISEHQEKLSKMRSFMYYYLPAAKKIVEQYAQLDKAAKGSFEDTKKKIKESMHMIMDAFERKR